MIEISRETAFALVGAGGVVLLLCIALKLIF
jgi:hypothetical protein